MFAKLRHLAPRRPRKLASAPFDLHLKGRISCVVEKFDGMVISGWAASGGSAPVALQLFAGSHRLDAPTQAVHRLDVIEHLGGSAPRDAQLGFRMVVPPDAWTKRDAEGGLALHLELDGTDHGLPAIPIHMDHLWSWLDRLTAIEDPEQRLQEWQRVSAHFRAAGSASDVQLAEQRWADCEAAQRARDSLPGARLKWAIEQVDELGVTGWAASPNGGDDCFEVSCLGRLWPAAVVRFERTDVQSIIPWARPDSGFHLSIPADIWQGAALDAELEIRILLGGRSLVEPALQLSRSRLTEVLCGWSTGPQPVFPDAAEQRFRVLRLVEHLSGAGGLDSLPEPAARYLEGLAAEQHLELPLPSHAGKDRELSQLHEGIWLLQREFNKALPPKAEGASALLALEQVLAHHGRAVSAASRHRFTVSMVPFFCSLDALAGLRPQLEQTELDQLAIGQGRWELSLLLPVMMLDELSASPPGRLDKTAALAERLARSEDGGWLNTAALLDAWRRLSRLPAGLPIDDSDRSRFVQASVALVESIGHGHASRLHDDHLVRGMWHLLAASRRGADEQAEEVANAAVRLLGLVPAFWQAWQASGGPHPLPARLRRCRDALATLQASLPALGGQPPAAVDTCWQALASLRQLGCVEIDSLHRHVLLLHAAVSPPGQPSTQEGEQLMGGLPEAEWLRWQGRRGEMPADDLLQRHAPARPVANSGHRQAVQAAWPPDIGAALALAGEAHQFSGLVWLAEAAHCGVDAANQALPAAIDRVLEVCTRHRHLHPVPPAALSATLAWARRAADETPLAGWPAQALHRTYQLWPGDEQPILMPLPTTPKVPVRSPALAPVVVVQVPGAPGAPPVLPEWVGTLATRGIPWVLWQENGAFPQAEVAQGSQAGSSCCVQASNLMGMLAWLLHHCDFGRVLVIDYRSELCVDSWLGRSGDLGHHYHGLVVQAAVSKGHRPADKTPLGTRFVRLRHGLSISRYAAVRALGLQSSARGAMLRRGALDAEKYLGDLLNLAGIQASNEGHVVHLSGPLEHHETGTGYLNFFPPSPHVPTVVSGAAPPHPAGRAARRLWPLDIPPSFDHFGRALQLVEVSPAGRAEALDKRPGCIVVAVLRNERQMLGHFLQHYRRLGVAGFVLVDNLSTDGSREHLLEQDDVVLYSADSAYSTARYGVTWQQAVLAAHGQRRWSAVVDLDELLVWPACAAESLDQLCHRLEAGGFDAARALMVDMYPPQALQEADLAVSPPFEAAPCFDAEPALRWRIGSGSYSNGPSWVSALRHRLMPHSPPNFYTSQKLALLRYGPWVRTSEGLHYAAGLNHSTELLALAHFKYHKGFHDKVNKEVARAEHYNGAEEYRQYQRLLAQGSGSFHDEAISVFYRGPESLSEFLSTASR